MWPQGGYGRLRQKGVVVLCAGAVIFSMPRVASSESLQPLGLGLHPNTLRFRMKKLGIVCPDRRGGGGTHRRTSLGESA